MPLRDAPIQRKLMLVVLLTCGTALLLTCAAFVIYEVIAIRRNLVQAFTTRAEIIAANSVAALAFANPPDAENVLAAFKRDPRTLAACLYDERGDVFARYPADEPLESFPPKPPQPGHYFQSDGLVVITPVVQGNHTFGAVYIKASLSTLTDRYRAFTILTLTILTGSLLVAYLISRKLQQQVSAPILALADTARAISDRQDYSVRATKLSNDELGELTDGFNRMLAQIERQTQALSESEGRLRAVLNSALSAVVVMDAQGRIVDWNARAEAMFGWPRGEAIGRDLSETIIPARHREAHRRGMNRFLQTGKSSILNQLVEMTAQHHDGREFPVELSISPLKSGDSVTFCGFITDITERKQAARQAELFAQLGHRLSTASSAAAAAQVIADVAAELLKWDACTLDLYHGQQDVIVPVFSVDTIDGVRTDVPPAYTGTAPSPMASQVLKEGAKLILREPPFTFAPGCVPFGNASRPSASLMFVPIRRGNSVMGILSIQSYTPGAYDPKALTLLQSLADLCSGALERVRAEEDLHRLNEELEQRVLDRTAQLAAVNQELESFSYSVSHDLRAPLRHVSGFAELLQQESGSTLSETGRKYLRLMSDAARRMGALIDDLLVFSRMGRTSLRRARVDTNVLVAEVVGEMAADLQGRDIQWNIAPLPELSVDRAMFKQVWFNLLSNAVKYTRQKERAEIHIQCRKNGANHWEFSVRDNGAGFDMQYADKLFGVFQRLHHAEEFEGTGIGLANVRRIVLRHGGSTWAEGRVGEGATFHFSLPPFEEKSHETETYSARRRQPE